MDKKKLMIVFAGIIYGISIFASYSLGIQEGENKIRTELWKNATKSKDNDYEALIDEIKQQKRQNATKK